MRLPLRFRASILTIILCIGLFLAMTFSRQVPTSAAQSNFVGGAPSRPDSSDMRAIRLRFEAGSRSNWHSHSGWQILMAEDGKGRTQERGKAIQDLLPGTPVYAGPDVVHWHGASPDEHVVQLTFISGSATWHEPVTEDDYQGR